MSSLTKVSLVRRSVAVSYKLSMGNRSVSVTSLEHELLRLVGRGMVISPEVLFYAESTCGLRAEEIESALRDPRFEERDELLALILTPDMEMRLALEPHLRADAACSPAELARLVRGLSRKIEAIRLLLPGGISFDLQVDETDIGYFVTKFYLDRVIDSGMVAALEKFLPPETVFSCRLVIRCRGAVYTAKQIGFLRRFIAQSRAYEDQMVELFTLMVALLAQMQIDESIEDHLRGRCRQLLKKLREIKEFEQKRDHYSMEYLMMQRYPIPHESAEQVWDQLQMLTVITDSILGLSPDPSLQAELRNLGEFDRRTDVSEIIRMLS